MSRFWGDDSWRQAAYTRTPTLFEEEETKTDNETVVAAFRQRLQDTAEFQYVPTPIPMRNSIGRDTYYLFFASPKAVAGKIVAEIFDKYRERSR
jgi:three-Cys-motif partner protein